MISKTNLFCNIAQLKAKRINMIIIEIRWKSTNERIIFENQNNHATYVKDMFT